MITRQPHVERRTAKVGQSETDVLPLCHATNVFWFPGRQHSFIRCLFAVEIIENVRAKTNTSRSHYSTEIAIANDRILVESTTAYSHYSRLRHRRPFSSYRCHAEAIPSVWKGWRSMRDRESSGSCEQQRVCQYGIGVWGSSRISPRP